MKSQVSLEAGRVWVGDYPFSTLLTTAQKRSHSQ